MNNVFFKVRERFRIGEDIFTVSSIEKEKGFTKFVLISDDADILDSELDYYNDDKIVLRKKQKIKCVIRKNSISNNGRILQLSNVSKNVFFDKHSNKLRKSNIYELIDIHNNKTRLKLEKFEDGMMIIHDYLELTSKDILPPSLDDNKGIDEEKKFVIKFKEQV